MIQLRAANEVADGSIVQTQSRHHGITGKRITPADPNEGGTREIIVLRPANGTSTVVGDFIRVGGFELVIDYGFLDIKPQSNGSIVIDVKNISE